MEYNDCSYDVLDDTITFKYRPNDDQSYTTSECSIEDNNLKCKNLGYIDTVKNELWKKQ